MQISILESRTGGIALPRFQRAMAKAAAVLKVSSDPGIVVRGMNSARLDLTEFIPLFFFWPDRENH